MYSVMIVDDEKFIRKSIRNRVEWEEYGLFVAGEAGNGEEALQLLETLRPDIVLVDIRMPVMDGLTFIKEAKRRMPKCSYIVMSAYNDFSYARKALQLGVEDYVLKPVDEEELYALLKKIVHRKNEEKLSAQISRMEWGESRDIPLGRENMQSVSFWVKNGEVAEQQIEEILSEETAGLRRDISLYYLRDYSRSNCFVYLLNGDSLEEEYGERLIQIVLKRFPQMEISAACSQVKGCERAGEAAKDSVNTLKKKIFQERDRVILKEKAAETFQGNQKKRFRDSLSHLYGLLMDEEYKKGMAEFDYIIEQTIKKEYSAELIEEIIGEILALLRHIPGEKESGTDFNIMFYKFRGKDYLLEYDTFRQVKDDLKALVHLRLENLYDTQEKDVINSIKNYIQQNYSDTLNAADLAQRFYINASYLSTLFKEKTGMNLTAYIEGTRMEKAKQFLESGNMSVTEVAIETGYSDSGYFSKVFKKYTGFTPKQYRGNAGNK